MMRRFGGIIGCDHGRRADGRMAERSGREQHSEGEIAMQDSLTLSLAASILLGMWLIWKITP